MSGPLPSTLYGDISLSQEHPAIHAAPWLVKSMIRRHALPHFFSLPFEERCSHCSKACASIYTAARPILIHYMDPFPASYRMRVFLVLDPQPAVVQPVSRQRPGPLSARAKTTQCNAKQCFQNGARRERPLDGSEACASDVRGGFALSYAEHAVVGPLSAFRLTDHR